MSIGKKTCERLTPGRSAIDPSFLLTRRSLYDYLVLLWQWIVNWWRKRGRFLKIPNLWVCSSLHSNNGLITAISLIPSRPEVYSFSCTYFSANKKWMCPSPLDFREVEKALGSWSIPCPLRSRSLPRPAPNPLSLCVLCDSSSTRRSWPEQWSGAAVMAGIALDGGAGGCWGRHRRAGRRRWEQDRKERRVVEVIITQLHDERFPTAVGKSDAWLLSWTKWEHLFSRLLAWASYMCLVGRSHRFVWAVNFGCE
jgi:hypothetical protein